ncbi:MAG TPA: hypothetical protein VN618_04055 [Solirubrobacteraceae bacterium]|nr:hypothetical protein [Solirubrobacteraceae bacterium]
MFGPTIACLVLGLAAGMWSAARYLPPRAQTEEGVIATWLVRGLIGCALAWAAVQIYFAIHAYANLHSDGTFPRLGASRTEILSETVQSILLLDGLLIGVAAVVHLLTPRVPSRGPTSAAD